ncbi:hypothetical protein FKP32DRAFT_65889 [Trametes sanguinea]|nr:hypothetical protein FKP32DRAFT_65889 [Trametes sanguinea]
MHGRSICISGLSAIIARQMAWRVASLGCGLRARVLVTWARTSVNRSRGRHVASTAPLCEVFYSRSPVSGKALCGGLDMSPPAACREAVLRAVWGRRLTLNRTLGIRQQNNPQCYSSLPRVFIHGHAVMQVELAGLYGWVVAR